jgi:hypothetical protein
LRDRGGDDDNTNARRLAETALAAALANGYGYVRDDARTVLEHLR